jgi:hypothetical protein
LILVIHTPREVVAYVGGPTVNGYVNFKLTTTRP